VDKKFAEGETKLIHLNNFVMKKIILYFVLHLLTLPFGFAQSSSEHVSFTTGELKAGYGITQFGKGLKEAYDAGNFGTSGGGLYVLSAHRKFARIAHLQFGLKVKALGAGPAMGDYGDEMFFNYWSLGASAKYYVTDKNAQKGLVLYGDLLFVSQFTQKYRNTDRNEYNHQFAIGQAINGGIGYDYPLGVGKPVLTFTVEFESARRRGEVTGIGDKTFRNTNFGVLVGVRF
jgi:hypothetical protein